MPTYIPLRQSKVPAVSGWNLPGYKGVLPTAHRWVGLRTDGLLVVDFDSEEAWQAWRGARTRTIKTPRGYHAYYTVDVETGPKVGVLPHVDVRSGPGSYVVAPPTEGYEIIDAIDPVPFDQQWLPASPPPAAAGEGWTTVPEGRRNATLASLGGALRRQGAAPEVIYRILKGLNAGVCEPPVPDREVLAVARSVARYEPEPDETLAIEVTGEAKFDWLGDMTLPPPAEWWWHPYVPRGRLVLLDGSEGIGKGLLTVYVALRVAAERRVLWAASEDDPEEDLQRRLKAAGYDPGVHSPIGFYRRLPSFPADVDAVAQDLKDQRCGLLVLDPGRSLLRAPHGLSGSYNDEASIRPGLEALNRLARQADCTVLFVHHWNKRTDVSIGLRAGGSSAFAQVVRHRVSLAWVGSTESGRGALEVSKSNIAPSGHVMAYSVEATPALSTAVFHPRGVVTSHARLDDWLKAALTEAAGETPIQIDRVASVAAEVKALPPGSPAPSPNELRLRFGVESGEVTKLFASLAARGLIVRNGPTWVRSVEE